MKGRTWKGVSNAAAGQIKELLLSEGSTEDTELKGVSEVWRLRYEGSVFSYYASGAIYCSGGPSDKLVTMYERISELAG